MKLTLKKTNPTIQGTIHLAGSKSISNRVLLIRALSGQDFSIKGLANAKDTQKLLTLLSSKDDILDVGPAGTTYRFMTAYLAFKEGTQILTGSERMKQRPIKILVDALKKLGAQIDYLENEGFPPLQIGPPTIAVTNTLDVEAGMSSQYISALLMLAPTLPDGLILRLKGNIVSLPYIRMTLKIMEDFGIQYQWESNEIIIKPQSYIPSDYRVEADWSAASYYYAMAAFSESSDLTLTGLFEASTQGDSILAQLMTSFGVQTKFNSKGIQIVKNASPINAHFEWDFLECPDLAQTIAVICAGLGVRASFSGLQTLKIKETDRVAALDLELSKVGVQLEEIDYPNSLGCQILGKANIPVNPPLFHTYDDHRMAMAFAPFALFGEIQIEDPDVVVKSYPDYWKDLESLGFLINYPN
jgi:3-phosphoshikimate 1-carboxyvinyltransferase